MTKFRDAYGQEWLEVERLPQRMDLSAVSRVLHQHQVPHRIAEQGGAQVVWVARAEDRERVSDLIAAWRRGDIEIVAPPSGPGNTTGSEVIAKVALVARVLPVTCALLLLSLIGYLVIIADYQLQLRHWFTIVDISRYSTADLATIDFSEPWRLWTPMFLHFDLIHIAFNGLFIWLFGARLERVMGSWHLILFVVIAGVTANLGQLGWQSNPHFGGMSGVNFGFIGYIWLRQMFAPHPMLVFPKALIPMLLVMLLLGTFGVVDIFIQGRVANAAHITGLMVGVTWGLAAGLYYARGANSSN
ncbi:MAG: rhomboid family intramembrane serine protease [Cellvibrionaceae bacterium]